MQSGKSKPNKKIRTDRLNNTKVTGKCTKAKSNSKSTRTTIHRVSGKIKKKEE